MGLDNELMYLAAKAGGGQTSIYRHLGDGMERLVRQIFIDEYQLTEEEVNWGYVITEDNGTQTHRTLDGRLDLSMIRSTEKAEILADWYGRRLIVIDRWYPSSQTCSTCGKRTGCKPLNIRSWTCPYCGTHQDRDVNAAKNIQAAELAVIACGDGRKGENRKQSSPEPIRQ